MNMWQRFLSRLKFPRQTVDESKRGFSISAGIPVYEDTAMQVSAFYRGVIYISSQIAKLPWQVKDKDNNIQDDRISRLLNLRPNPEMSAMPFRLCMVQNAIIHGNSYAEIERDIIGRPVALWPIPSQSVRPYRTTSGALVYQIIASSSLVPGSDIYLDPNDIFHLKNFHTKDGIVGQGLVGYATEVLGISLGADRMAGNLFANGGLPSGVITVKGTLSDEAYKRIKESWKENHSGRKSGGVAVLEDESKFSPIAMSPDILQFLESRKFNVLEIARFLGLPPTKLFDTDASTFNNQENSNLEVATDTLDSWARALEGEADTKILNNQFGGRRTEFDLYAVFRGDMETRSNYFSKMMQTASITPNEIRRKEGLAPYKGGDRYYVAVNNYSPADRIDEIVDSQVQKANNPSSASGNGQKDTKGNRLVPSPSETGTQAELEKAAIKFLEGK